MILWQGESLQIRHFDLSLMLFRQVLNDGSSLIDLEPVRDGFDDLLDLASTLRDLDHRPGILPDFSTFQCQAPSFVISGSFPLLPDTISLERKIYLIFEFLYDQIWVPRGQNLYHILTESLHDLDPIHDLDLTGAHMRVTDYELCGIRHLHRLKCTQQAWREALRVQVLQAPSDYVKICVRRSEIA